VDRPVPTPPPTGPQLPDLDALIAEIGVAYPLYSYVPLLDDELEEEDAVDAVIYAGLVSG
jgi:hypothetical protein